jgi:hypothetical protein
MNQSSFSPTIGEYLRKRLMPVEGAIPQLAGIDMYVNSIPAGTVGGDLFEYINFQQRYNIDGRIARALKLAKLYLDPLPRVAVSTDTGIVESLAAFERSLITRLYATKLGSVRKNWQIAERVAARWSRCGACRQSSRMMADTKGILR